MIIGLCSNRYTIANIVNLFYGAIMMIIVAQLFMRTLRFIYLWINHNIRQIQKKYSRKLIEIVDCVYSGWLFSVYRIAARKPFYFTDYFELRENKIYIFVVRGLKKRNEFTHTIHATQFQCLFTFFFFRDGSPQQRLNQPFDNILCKCICSFIEIGIYLGANSSRKKKKFWYIVN